MPEPYQILPKRGRDTSKNDYGRLFVLGGSVGYTGAPTLCARAAVRAGAGRVYLGVPESIYTITAVKNDEAMPFPLPDREGKLSQDGFAQIVDRMKKCDVTVFGPGLGRTEETFRLVRALVRAAEKPLVLDADAIFAVSRDLSLLDRAKAPIYLTPHDGEFATLFGAGAGRDRRGETTAFAKAHRCTVIRKGAETICARPDGRTIVFHGDNPGMAKSGSGDVLAGVLGAFLCQLPDQWAAETAVWAHSLAGAICAERLGEYGMNPTDLINALAEATKKMTAEA
jgi:NAD(P)H-hydrate epimerase